MDRSRKVMLAAWLAASSLVPATSAWGASARENELEARLQRLEAEMAQLRADLATSRQEQAASVAEVRTAVAQATTTSETAATRVAALESKPASDGFKVGGTTIKLGGHVRVNTIASRWSDGDVAVGSLGKEFYLPQQIPVGDSPASTDLLISARQTRISLTATAPAGKHEVKGYVEFDFALATAPVGAQRATNPYTPTFRRGLIQYGGLLAGQEWSTFQNVAVLPETTDFVGPLDGTVFNRQALVRYTTSLEPNLQLSLALENPQTEVLQGPASATYVDIDDDSAPDVVARLDYKPKLGSFALAAIGRRLRVENAGVVDSALGWGVSASGVVPFGPDNRHDLRFMATYGQGIGRYLGLGYVADAVMPAVGADLSVIDNFAGFAALKLGWTRKLRSTFMGSYQWAGYENGIAVNPLANRVGWSGAANLFWTPAKGIDLGIEYRHAVRETLGGADGTLDRIEFAAKYGF